MTESVSQSVSAASWDGCVLRGVRLDTVLRRRAELLKASTGNEHTYQLSMPVRRLDAFLSHTWNTPYWVKWLTLSLEYHFGVAFVCCLLVCAVVSGLLDCKLLLFGVTCRSGIPRGPYCISLSAIVFNAVLLLWGGRHELGLQTLEQVAAGLPR